jgi:pimeloyl-ACP methyl ester carboxylesterase
LHWAAHFVGDDRYVEVDGAGHFPQRERPAQVTQQLLDWLTDPA